MTYNEYFLYSLDLQDGPKIKPPVFGEVTCTVLGVTFWPTLYISGAIISNYDVIHGPYRTHIQGYVLNWHRIRLHLLNIFIHGPFIPTWSFVFQLLHVHSCIVRSQLIE